jgi:hypothetical protein
VEQELVAVAGGALVELLAEALVVEAGGRVCVPVRSPWMTGAASALL